MELVEYSITIYKEKDDIHIERGGCFKSRAGIEGIENDTKGCLELQRGQEILKRKEDKK